MRRRSPPGRGPSVRFVADDVVRRELLGGVDAAQERAARLAGGLDLRLGELGAADRAGLLERVFEGALFEVHVAFIASPAAPVAARAPARTDRRARRPAPARRPT